MMGREIAANAADTSAEVLALIGVGGGEARTAPHIGIRALMLAVLDDAVRAYLGPELRCRDEAESWVADRRGRAVFSFNTVCETLGLDPSAVRRALWRLRADGGATRQPSVIRPRPNGRRQAGLRISVPRPRVWRKAAV